MKPNFYFLVYIDYLGIDERQLGVCFKFYEILYLIMRVAFVSMVKF